MQNRRLYLILLMLLAVAGKIGLSVTGALREKEPTYGGKSLSEWVMALCSKNSLNGDSEAENAIRHIGTNSLPYLLKWISYEPAPWRVKLYETAGALLKKNPNAFLQDRHMLLSAGAAKAFGALRYGEAEPAMGAINRMVHDRKLGMSRLYAVVAEAAAKEQTRVGNVTTFAGVDAFSLTYPTDGVPVLTISHTNAAAAIAAQVPPMP